MTLIRRIFADNYSDNPFFPLNLCSITRFFSDIYIMRTIHIKKLLITYSLLLITYNLVAQNKITATRIIAPALFSHPAQGNRLLFTQTNTAAVKPLPNYIYNYVLPKGAIFCRMEDALHSRFNIWIKFRMGDDDRYSN